jgi:hypothetical protein
MSGAMSGINLEFVTDRQEILTLLAKSKREGTSIGINSRGLGSGTFVTGVEDIEFSDEVLVKLKPFDATGRILTCYRLKLSQIQSVLPFTSNFQNPYLKDESVLGLRKELNYRMSKEL